MHQTIVLVTIWGLCKRIQCFVRMIVMVNKWYTAIIYMCRRILI